MNSGWHEVARLGLFPDGLPHVLVDAHGWCLRLGPGEDRYYSALPTLLQGLIEHLLRRRLREAGPLLSVQAMLAHVQAALDQAARFPTPNQSLIPPLEPLKPASAEPDLFSPRIVA